MSSRLAIGFCLSTFTLASAAFSQPRLNLARLRDYTNHRVSSHDRSGANDDGNWKNAIQPGETRTLAEIDGPAVISHIWITIATPAKWHLKEMVLRMYWDGEAQPSVEAPVGDFFGLGLGEYFLYESEVLSVGSQKALNSFFPMPFRRSARITVTNEGATAASAFYFNIDYEKHQSLPEDLGYFHAQYRQGAPTSGWTAEWKANGEDMVDDKPNLDGKDNYVILEAEGRGHYVGVAHSIQQNQGDWWGEGDEMISVDSEEAPGIIGTGSEDYYLGAWCYGGCGINPFGGTRPTFAYARYGNPMNGGDDRGAKWMVYRFHTESPIAFQKDIKVTIEHGHANHRSDNFFTTAYWYQTEPHRAFAPLPAASERIPRQFDTGGPTTGRP
ncbi:MAG TPA: glycoside hydrolase family 172 protein [Vicinamibacteria bacterium]|nr:glycoside hydrolase family 172 protein [Vicinamibacteria bacterium]